MNLFATGGGSSTPPPQPHPPTSPLPPHIEIVEPEPESCPESVLSPEGNVKLRNYRLVGPGPGSLRTYTPSGDIHTTPVKGKLVSRYEDFDCGVSPQRRRILELLRPDDPGRDAIEAIVRPAARRPHIIAPDPDTEHQDILVKDDEWNFLQRTLLSPSPCSLSTAGLSPEPPRGSDSDDDEDDDEALTLADELHAAEFGLGALRPPPPRPPREERLSRREALQELRERSSAEREMLARMALAVEEDEAVPVVTAAECGLAAAARQLDLMLAESRDLHEELAEIHDDMQAETRRAAWCARTARALLVDTRALRFLDDVLALLRGDVTAALRVRAWPFALGSQRNPQHNYIV